MKILDRGTVFDASHAEPLEKCNGFLSLARLADGMLICSFKSGPRKLGFQDRVVLMRSVDDGKHWERLFDGFDTTFAGTPGSFSGGYLFEPEPGRLLISLHWVDRSDPERPLSNPQTAGVLPMKYLLAESGDSGKTWSQPWEVSLAPHPGANPTGEIVRLQGGRLLLTYESWKEWDEVEGDQSANVKLSSDEGKTWGKPITMASDPEGQLYYWDNHLTQHPRTNQLLTAFWTHDAKQGVDVPIHLAWGESDGMTWQKPVATPIHGQIASPLFLDDDRLLLAYVHRHDPPSIRAVLSNDNGASWQLEKELVLHDCQGQNQQGMDQSRSEAEYWDDMTRWTFGHPKIVRLSGDQVIVVYYAPASLESLPPRNGKTTSVSTPTSIYWVRLG